MTQDPLLAPSVLSADFSKLKEQIQIVEQAGADWLHLDVMDGHFVPNLTFGPMIIRHIAKCTNLVLDAHLMVEQPEAYFKQLADNGVKCITIHQEIVTHLDAAISCIKTLGCKAGVALNPSTPLDTLDVILPELDLVLILSVNPGFGGQNFIPYCQDKIMALKETIGHIGKPIHIQTDGGVKVEHVQQLVKAGATCLVAGSAIFNDDPAGSCRAFKAEIQKAKE